MKSGSKYSALTEAMKEKIGILSVGIDDKIRQKQILAEISRIDSEVDRECDEIRNTPIDTALVEQQAEAEYQASLKANARTSKEMVNNEADQVHELERELEIAKRKLEEVKETSAEWLERKNMDNLQQVERTKASIGNKDKTIKLRVQKAKMEGEKRKANLQAELDNISAKTEAHSDKVKCVEQLYDDLKEISLKLGDVGK